MALRTRIFAFFLLAILGSGKPVFGADAFTAYRERTSILLIAMHCDALGKLEKTALVSGRAQARGALLRAGKTVQELDELEADLARRAALIACDREDVQTEITRMREAAQIWSRLYTMRFPSRWQNWEARRDDARNKARWRVRAPLSNASDTAMDFGLVAQGEKAFLDLVVLGGRTPTSVVLHIRDSNKLKEPMDNDLLRLMGRTGDSPKNLMPPQSVTQSFFAIDKMLAPPSLTGETGKSSTAILFRFADKALHAFSHLDPRDVVALELVYPPHAGAKLRRERVYAEVGDFASARLFAETFPEPSEPPKTN